MTINGYNDFYEGWLAFVLMRPFDPQNKSEQWKEGWRMGSETGEIAVTVLREEIRRSHIIVSE